MDLSPVDVRMAQQHVTYVRRRRPRAVLGAAEDLDGAVGPPSGTVTGAARHRGTDTHLASHADRHRCTVPIQDVQDRSWYRPSGDPAAAGAGSHPTRGYRHTLIPVDGP
jgi:hypothetical protein